MRAAQTPIRNFDNWSAFRQNPERKTTSYVAGDSTPRRRLAPLPVNSAHIAATMRRPSIEIGLIDHPDAPIEALCETSHPETTSDGPARGRIRPTMRLHVVRPGLRLAGLTHNLHDRSEVRFSVEPQRRQLPLTRIAWSAHASFRATTLFISVPFK